MRHFLDKPYDREFFEKYQTQLLYAFNDPKICHIIRWYFKNLLQIDNKQEIIFIAPNSYRIYKGYWNKKYHFESVFYSRAEFYLKLHQLAKFIRYASQLLPLAIPAASGIPVFALTTTTFNPDADPETTSVDGSVFRNAGNAPGETFATIQVGAGSTALPSSATEQASYLEATTTTNDYQYLTRGFFLFDTSPLPDTDTVDAGTKLTLYVNSKNDNLGGDSIRVVTSTPASNTNLVAADYSQSGTVAQATDATIASLTTGAVNDWSFNATGRSNVSLTGISKFGTKFVKDADNGTPTWASASIQNANINYAESAANKPLLTVVHSAGAGAAFLSKLALMGAG